MTMKSLTTLILATLMLSGCSSINSFPGRVFDKFKGMSERTAPNHRNYADKERTESVAVRKNPEFVVPVRRAVAQPHKINVKHSVKKKIGKKAKYKSPAKTIDEANKRARIKPDLSNYQNAIMRYEFSSGGLYQIYTAPLRITDIRLQPGEKIIGKPAAGDTARWILGLNNSIHEGQTRQHILIKPTKPDLSTTLIINTNRRTYLMELTSYNKTYMAAVDWHYPEYESRLARQKAAHEYQLQQRQQAHKLQIPKKRNFDYKITYRWKKPNWTPVQVFDDGSKVYIRFPEARKNYEAPALFVVNDEGKTQLVNYRVKDDYYIVDRLFNVAELRIGQKNSSVVKVSRLDS